MVIPDIHTAPSQETGQNAVAEGQSQDTAQSSNPQQQVPAKQHAHAGLFHKKPTAPEPPKPPKPPHASNPVIKPILVASILTAALMALTVATYINDNKTQSTDNNKSATESVIQTSQLVPLTTNDIDEAIRYTDGQINALDSVQGPTEADLSDESLGL